MYIKNKFLFLSLLSLAVNSHSMKRARSENGDSDLEISGSPVKKKRTERAPSKDEEKFILLAREQTFNNQKLTRLKLVLKELLIQPNNKFYSKIIDAITDRARTEKFKTHGDVELKKGNLAWSKKTILRRSSFSTENDTFVLQADDNQFNPGKQILLKKNNQDIINLNAQDKVYGLKFSPDGNYAISISWNGLGNSILELWDLTNKTNPKTQSIASIENWADDVAFLGWDIDNKFIIKGRSDKWYIKPFTQDRNLKEILHENFQKLYAQTTTRIDSDGKEFTEQTGIIKYLLINYIINHGNKEPFVISYPRLKAIFKQLPQVVQDAFVDLKYVKL